MTIDVSDEVRLVARTSPGQQEIHDLVFLALQSRQNDRPLDRRSKLRRPFPYPVYLTPISSGTPDVGETITVLGKHLSELGLDFYHSEVLPYRKMVASLEIADAQWIAFEITLNWCRFGRHGWYESGGKFNRSVASPIGANQPPSNHVSTA